MRVNKIGVESPEIANVIDKLMEADGSPLPESRVQHLLEASRLLTLAIGEEMIEHVKNGGTFQ